MTINYILGAGIGYIDFIFAYIFIKGGHVCGWSKKVVLLSL